MPSTTVHARFVKTATRLIDKHGRAMELLVPVKSGPEYNRVTTWTPTDIVGVMISYNLVETDGNLVQADDKKILVAANGLTIDQSMRIRDGGFEYSIISVAEVRPGTTSILYTVQARL